ncbi:hypothetical protein RSOL_374870 [Rhizoctonia solani AG-3 Rhs1AP]|nr:hypothetical protein RSOL_374870 [Rhizoctonia solani AG-3 Rhs1AP]
MLLPEEILSSIFVSVVYAPYDEKYPFPATMNANTHICRVYQRVHSLLAVCKAWRNETLPSSTVSLPKLESLYLESPDVSSLRVLFTAISPGPYYVTLDISDDICGTPSDEPFTEEDFALLKAAKVDQLIVSPWAIFPCDTMTGLRRLLESVPTVTALVVSCFTLDAELLEVFTPPESNSGTATPDNTFPHFQTVEMYQCKCHLPVNDLQEEFRALLSGHSIRKMILQFTELLSEDENAYDEDGLEDDEAIKWLRANIPEFYLHCPDYDDFLMVVPRWQLWDV